MRWILFNLKLSILILLPFQEVTFGEIVPPVGFSFDEEYLINTTGEAYTFTRCVATGDLDLDGDEDVIVSDRYNEDIVLFLNDGQGNLSQTTSLFATEQNRIVILEDLNNDGLLDLSTACKDGANVFFNLGHSKGEWLYFSAPLWLPAGANPHWIDVEDMNNDNYPDLLVADFGEVDGDAGWYVYLNNGDNTFQEVIHYNLGKNGRCISIIGKDFDSDGFADVAVIGHQKVVHFYSNQGLDLKTNEWLGANHESIIVTEIGACSIRSLDIESDNDTDLVIAHRTAEQTTLLINDGSGTFSYNPMPTSRGELVEPVDINIDGHTDLALVQKETGVFQIMLNNGLGEFENVFSSPMESGIEPKFIAFSDLDNDDDKDVILVNSFPGIDQGSIRIFLNEYPCNQSDLNGDCTVNISDLLLLIDSWGNCSSSCNGDYNQDGIVDVDDLLVLLAMWE